MSKLGLYNCWVDKTDNNDDINLVVLARCASHAKMKVRDFLIYKLYHSSTFAGRCTIGVHSMNNTLLQCGVAEV